MLQHIFFGCKQSLFTVITVHILEPCGTEADFTSILLKPDEVAQLIFSAYVQEIVRKHKRPPLFLFLCWYWQQKYVQITCILYHCTNLLLPPMYSFVLTLKLTESMLQRNFYSVFSFMGIFVGQHNETLWARSLIPLIIGKPL